MGYLELEQVVGDFASNLPTAIGGWFSEKFAVTFCEKFYLRLKAMSEIRKLVYQLIEEGI